MILENQKTAKCKRIAKTSEQAGFRIRLGVWVSRKNCEKRGTNPILIGFTQQSGI
jgi:hypothetical protein